MLVCVQFGWRIFDCVAAGKYQLGIRCYVDLSSANVLFILTGLYSFVFPKTVINPPW